MPRKKRIWYPGAIYHVMSRGIRRTAIYEGREDYIRFLEIMQNTREKYTFNVFAICLMTNHFHMEIETQDVELWKIMQNIKSRYAEDFNRRHEYSGHLFEGRYAASLIRDERYFLEVSRYIHLNPVKAGMVREPCAYDYSSYGLFVPKRGRRRADKASRMIADLVDTERVLGTFQIGSRQQYRTFVEGTASHEEQEMMIRKEMGENEFWMPR